MGQLLWITEILQEDLLLKGFNLYKLKDDILFTKHHDNSTVLLSLIDQDNSFFKITGISQEIIAAINEGKDIQQVSSEILSKYEVDSSRLDQDIKQFISYLLTNNIIEEK
jgi:hypothetical protein